ncbi:MAG: DUF3291 domain-containing protein [Hyphomonas sp.]|nr:DUF3291 domain-containing protein [Hyphomonas sp.]
MDYRLIHFNCARPVGAFSFENEFVRVFISILPRIFRDADEFEGLHWHDHGIRRPDGVWLPLMFPYDYPHELGSPDISTMAGWNSIEDLTAFSHSGGTHPPGMRRLADQIDRSDGPGFVMWWAPRGQRFTMEDGWQKLQLLRQNGPSPEAFSLDQPVAKPAAA